MAHNSRRLFSTAVGLSALLFAAGCAPTGAATPEAEDKDPLKIGILMPYSGPLGLYGTAAEQAVRAYFEETGPINGRGVEIFTYDDAGSPEAGLAGAQRLVERDEVDVLIGPILGPVVLAVAQQLDGGDVPVISPIPQTGMEGFPMNFTTGFHFRQLTEPFGRYAYEELGYETAYIFASDYVGGHEVVNGFRKGFESAGGTIVGEAYPPLGTTDMVPYLPGAGEADVAFGFTPGADAIRFVKQYSEAGLKDDMPLIAYGMVSNLTLDAIGADAAGVQSLTQYPESGLESAAFAEFQAALEGKTDADVRLNFVHAGSYAAAQAVRYAMEELGDDYTPEDLLAAISSVEFDAPWGPFRFDSATGYAYVPGYHVVIEKGDDGRFQQQIVSEFETFSPEDALASVGAD